ncbi:MAG: MFS transporter [Burkholderiaceae bacterium]
MVALLGTGLATIALSLLAYDLAGGQAGRVLGTVLAIKMIAYVVIAPLSSAFVDRLPRRTMLVALDLVRAAIALLLPWVTDIWQIYLLIFLLQAASAAFTPTFQATIPDVLPDERQYTQALSLSRLAVELENILSPALAAVALLAVSYDALFLGTVAGFVASALLIMPLLLPRPQALSEAAVLARTMRGIRFFLATPRLRGLLAMNFAAAAIGAMVLVNTVVLVRADLGQGETAVAVSMGFFGAGSILTALLLSKVLARLSDRSLMLGGIAVMVGAVLVLAGWVFAVGLSWAALLAGWLFVGMVYSAVTTPAGRVLRRSAHAADRPALFAAQFSLTHACWLIAYPLAGWLHPAIGFGAALLATGSLAMLGLAIAATVWPANEPVSLLHRHDDLPLDHPHLQGVRSHCHDFVIDDHHPRWP